MDEQELRELIRESIARHTGGDAVRRAGLETDPRAHVSHGLLPLVRGGDEDDGRCLIEPAVRCNHCGYCVSLGH